jgi:hypothetical protein
MAQLDLGATKRYGFKPSFNETYEVTDSSTGWWVTPCHFGVDQGPVILMIENYRTGLIWNIMRRSPCVVTGLRRAGFRGRMALTSPFRFVVLRFRVREIRKAQSRQ